MWPLDALLGTVNLKPVDVTLENGTETPFSVTALSPDMFVPVTVTVAPSAAFLGERLEIAGGGMTVNLLALDAVPPGPTRDTTAVDAPDGTVTVTDVSEVTTNPADTRPTFAAVTPSNPVPVTLKVEPTMPLVGPIDEIVGVIEKLPELVAAPPAVVTAMCPDVEPDGTMKFSDLDVTLLKLAVVPFSAT
jgi:hypothetical protein